MTASRLVSSRLDGHAIQLYHPGMNTSTTFLRRAVADVTLWAETCGQIWGIGRKPFLLLMGRRDAMNDPARVEAFYRKYLEGANTKLIWYDQNHK